MAVRRSRGRSRAKLLDASAVQGRLQYLRGVMPQVVDAILRKVMQAIRREARRMVPQETGHLERGIRYEVRDGVAVIYAYTRWGGVQADYAVKQHEDETIPHAPGESAHYIEKPLVEIGGTAAAVVAREVLRRAQAGLSLTGWRVKV